MEAILYRTEQQNAEADFTCLRCQGENMSIYAHCWECRTLHAESLTVSPVNSPAQVIRERAIAAAQSYASPEQFQKIEAAKNALTFCETANSTLWKLTAQEEKLVCLAVGNPEAFGEREADQLKHLRVCIAAQWDRLEARKRMAANLNRKAVAYA